MTNVTLERYDGQVFTFQDGDCKDVKPVTTSEIDAMPIPGTGSSGAILQDINGALKTIVITGELHDADSTRVAGQTVLTISAQKSWLEACQNGLQLPKTFTSNFDSSEVMMAKIEFTEIAGEPTHLPYTINLTTGT